jgi:hypothetical protein
MRGHGRRIRLGVGHGLGDWQCDGNSVAFDVFFDVYAVDAK